MALDEDSLLTGRPIRILVQSRKSRGSMMSRRFIIDQVRCLIVVHTYFLAQRDTDLLAESAHLSCAKLCIDVSCFSPDLYKDKRATLNKRQKNETSNSETFVTETNQPSWNLLINAIFARSNNNIHDGFRD